MDNLQTIFENAIWNIFNTLSFIDFIDILFVAFIVYNIILIIKESRAITLLVGISFIVVFTFLSNLFGLKSLNWMLRGVLNNGVLVMVILFSSEIRKVIEQLGLVAFKDSARRQNNDSDSYIVDSIVDCCINLSKRRVGALIVFEQKMTMNDVAKTGTYLNAEISSGLLENIFEPNTPLHDGAVIIRGDKILAASCILTLTQSDKINKELGTRHRAAIGISEQSDAIALIVSEETGVISIAEKGKLERHLDRELLQTRLRDLYSYKEVNTLKKLFSRNSTRKNKNE